MVVTMDPTVDESPRTDSGDWLAALRGEGAVRDEAIRRLYDLLLRAARFEVGRRRVALSYVRGEELDDIATQAADDALMAVLGKLDDFRGERRASAGSRPAGGGAGSPPGRTSSRCSRRA